MTKHKVTIELVMNDKQFKRWSEQQGFDPSDMDVANKELMEEALAEDMTSAKILYNKED